MNALAEIHDLLQRAVADLRAGWPEAAYDALGAPSVPVRAMTLHAATLPQTISQEIT